MFEETLHIESFRDHARDRAFRRTLHPGETVVTFIDAEEADDPEQHAALSALLCEEERQRLERFHFESDRRLFIVAHALVRLALSQCAEVDPKDWRFSKNPHGRPEIAPPERLRFSLSHTKGLAACAITLDRDIGLDTENLSRPHRVDGAERFFSSRELADLRSLPPAARAARFFDYWTLKEAYIKARGLGLSLPLDGFSLYQDSNENWRIDFAPSCPDNPARWKFWSFKIGELHQCALAVSSEQP